jgi:hypothetical protein
MPDETDWLYRPMTEHFCKYESLIDGTLDLADIAEMNDIISVRDENQARVRAYMDRRSDER